MSAMRSVALLACIVGVCSLTARVTPVEKVITLMKVLKMEVEVEGRTEATTYDKFACFCKTTTVAKSKSVNDGNDNIDRLSSHVALKTEMHKTKEEDLVETKEEEEKAKKELEAAKTRCAKEKADYLAENADLSKAISSLEGAIAALVNTGGAQPTLLTMRSAVTKNVALAQAMKMVSDGPHWATFTSLLETSDSVDPDDPSYKYHSQHVIQMLHMLKLDFDGKKLARDAEYAKTKKACDDEQRDLGADLLRLGGDITNLKVDISKLIVDIATHRSDLVTAESLMKDDQLYLKDLTALCELRANEWDQRTQMRNGELTALTGALNLLENDGKSADELVNDRALLVQTPVDPVAPSAIQSEVQAHGDAPSFLQEVAAVQLRGSSSLAMLQEQRKHSALDILRHEGGRLGSAALSALAVRSANDPFKNVKRLIQKLIERLVDESTQEATKKGFCDESLADARLERKYRWEAVLKLDGEVGQLKAKKASLEDEIDELTGSLLELTFALGEATRFRAQEKIDNAATIKTANEGNQAISEALIILKTFYADALKASLLQTKLSPVEEDNPGAGFNGAYKGQQTSSKGIVGLLEVIKSDFERTSRKTTAAEKEADAAFVLYDRATKADISGKTTKKTLDEEDLKTTITKIASGLKDMQDNMDLVDKANAEITSLKPMCIDTGMSYAERVKKREDEIVALKAALCLLDPDNVEASCKGR